MNLSRHYFAVMMTEFLRYVKCVSVWKLNVLCWPNRNSEGGNTLLHGIIGITEPDTSDDIMPFGIIFQMIKWMPSGCSDLTLRRLVMKNRRQTITV